ncbi:hypothetical protein E1161_04250 [Saccharopolyspora aridisoli]|uniref:Uncharacterized protein n=1 Tax=Saccharopolyspora aridisoli TaxID=2530385 RepID=A0A4V6PCD4_9PSEU|nr:hypothetical protein [Saccharopolyspora aridisoli]TDC95405.1 hypothetical protein E1161_04250 [Saccharopolyspora aridisoli]
MQVVDDCLARDRLSLHHRSGAQDVAALHGLGVVVRAARQDQRVVDGQRLVQFHECGALPPQRSLVEVVEDGHDAALGDELFGHGPSVPADPGIFRLETAGEPCQQVFLMRVPGCYRHRNRHRFVGAQVVQQAENQQQCQRGLAGTTFAQDDETTTGQGAEGRGQAVRRAVVAGETAGDVVPVVRQRPVCGRPGNAQRMVVEKPTTQCFVPPLRVDRSGELQLDRPERRLLMVVEMHTTVEMAGLDHGGGIRGQRVPYFAAISPGHRPSEPCRSWN